MNEPATQQPGVQDAVRSTWYLIFGFALSWLPLPYSGLAAVPLVASLIYGVKHLRAVQAAASKAGKSTPFVPHLISLGLTTALIAMVMVPVVQYETTMDYQECMAGANTMQAQQACESQYGQHPGFLQKLFGN